MNIQQKNLAFSLPDEVLAKVWEYDSTYKSFFSDLEFNHDIYDAYEITKAIWSVRCHLKSYFCNGKSWHNEYASINEPYQYGIQSLKSENDFVVKYYKIGGYLFYKILPKGVNCTFLRKPEYFDGCLVHDCFLEDDINMISNNIDNEFVVLFGVYT